MFKVVALLTRKPDLPKADFIRYYEDHHVPLIYSLFSNIREYRRSFVDLTGAIILPGAAPPDFDVITELWFDDRAGYDHMLALHADPAVAGAIATDEENFLDRSKTRMFVVEEHGVG